MVKNCEKLIMIVYCLLTVKLFEDLKYETILKFVGFEVLKAVAMKSSIFYTCYLLHASFLYGLLFSPEDGCDMFFWNVG
jgi:hypothetical protein